MLLEDLVLVSVDDHVIEPPDMFEGRLAARWTDRAPRMVRQDTSDVWLLEGLRMAASGLNTTAGRPREEWGSDPSRLDEIRAGCYDVDARVGDMNAGGVLGALCFPSFPGFAGRLFAALPDREYALAVLQAYNDWSVDAWIGRHPDRFIPLMVPPYWDADAAAREVRRMAARGVRAVTFLDRPEELGLPSIHSDHWDPLWSACADEGLVVCMHIGGSGHLVQPAPDAPINVLIQTIPMNVSFGAANLLWSPVLRRYPTLRFALSEGGSGWVPYFLERADYVYENQIWTKQDFGDLKPSDVFRRQVLTCFIEDAVGIELRHRIGVQRIAWECDYPHSDSTWPLSPERLLPQLAGLTDSEVDRITHLNAMEWFRFDPFSGRGRASCTVGALREKAAGVDLTPLSTGRRAGSTLATASWNTGSTHAAAATK